MEIFLKILNYVVLILTTIVCSIICINDVHKREIENWMNGLLFGCGLLNLVFLSAGGLENPGTFNYLYLIFGGIMFLVFFGIPSLIFAICHGEKTIGGGDVKLLGACGIFLASMNHIFHYCFYMLIASILVWALAKILDKKTMPGGPIYTLPLIITLSVCNFSWLFGLIYSICFVIGNNLLFFILAKLGKVKIFEGEANQEE